jgi:hypothetical protein
MKDGSGAQREPQIVASRVPSSQSIDWYSEGESRTVEVDGIRIEVRFIGRKGRGCRIAITAPPGATFRSFELKVTDADQSQKRLK